MAKLYAYGTFAFDYSRLNFNLLLQGTERYFDDDSPETFEGTVYPDMFWFDSVEGNTMTSFAWCGPGLTASGDSLTGGTVTAIRQEFMPDLSVDEYSPVWMLFDFSRDAMTLWNAALTPGTRDDFSLFAAAMAGNDTVRMGAGNDVVRGYAGHDTMSGNGGNDRLLGDAGNDTIQGGAGADVFDGGTGKDLLSGGAGRDVFDFDTVAESGLAATRRDVVADFVSGVDRIDLSGIDANTAMDGNQAFRGTLIAPSATFTLAGQLRLSGGILYGNTDTDADAEFSIALTGVASLSGADLVL